MIEPAAAVKTTARSGRNGALVGGLIGLLLGCAAALLADPFLDAPRPHRLSRWSTGSASRSSSPPTTRSG